MTLSAPAGADARTAGRVPAGTPGAAEEPRSVSQPKALTRPLWSRLGRESVLIFVLVLGLNLGVAHDLVFHLDYITVDALSRVANAFFVLFSRDPHLAAIGLVWNPLPSFLELPLVALKGWFPWLVNRGFAGNIETAGFGAGGAVVIGMLLRDVGVGRPMRLAMVVAWVTNPMVLLYSANGMSDITLMFFLLLTGLLLLRWLRQTRDVLLVGIGTTVALATFVRYEAIPFAILVFGVIAVSQWWSGAPRRELEARLLLYGLPVAFAVLFWIGANAVLMHNPLYFLNGLYSNLSQQGVVNNAGTAAAARLESWPAATGFVASEVIHLYPAYPLCAGVALGVALWRRRALVGVATLLMTTAPLLLVFYLIERGSLNLNLRYFMSVIPFSFVLAAYGLGLLPKGRVKVGLGLTLAAALALSSVSTLAAMSSSRVGLQEHQVVAAARWNRPLANGLLAELDLGRTVQRLDRGHQLVLIDSFTGFPVVMGSPDPRLFVITSDRNFQAALSDPQAYHIGYFLVPEPAGVTRLDAIDRRYPGFWSNGGGFATMVAALGTAEHWRLYRITGPAPQ